VTNYGAKQGADQGATIMARGITEKDVFTACDALVLAGERPTIERVRQKIGRGSPNTVSPMLDTWFKGLGRRLQDPGAFAPPPALPEPVLQAAMYFWETALALARTDFDTRLREGLAEAGAAVEAQQNRADQAEAVASQATANATRLHQDLFERVQQLEQVQQDLAAERARLEGVRTALAEANERINQQDAKSTAELVGARHQLAAAIDRADAADRRVALELERERAARAKAERQVETLQRSLDAARAATTTAKENAQSLLAAGRDREQVQAAQQAALAAELAMERVRLSEVRAAGEAAAQDAATARSQVADLQASLDRLAALVEVGMRVDGQAARKRSAKGSSTASTA
jgi:hypothetical protein